MKSKTKKYRSLDERGANADGKKRGNCITLFRKVSNCTSADLCFTPIPGRRESPFTNDELTVGELKSRLGVKDLFFEVAGENEFMRDMNDVEAVMVEYNLVGSMHAFRKVGSRCRIVQYGCAFAAANEAPEPEKAKKPPTVFEQVPTADDYEAATQALEGGE